MPIGDWTPPAGWTWSDSGGWLPPSYVPEIERLRAENARLETMLQGEIFVRDNLLEVLGHEKDLRAEIERLRAVEADTRNMRDAAIEESERLRALLQRARDEGYEELHPDTAKEIDAVLVPPQDSGKR